MRLKTKPLRYIQYTRKSSQGEGRQVASLQDQEKILRDLASREGLTIIRKLSEAKSAKAPHVRPIFREMLNSIKEGRANAILCWHINRLYRNPWDAGEIQWMLQEGIIQCIKTPEREYHPEDHALLIAVESSMASQYVRDLKRDVARGVREKAERGTYPYRPKAGYLLDPISRDVVQDPIRFPLLQDAWTQFLAGIYSVPQVLQSLNGKGYRTPRTRSGGNKPLSRSSLYRLFTDPFYKGDFEFDGRTIRGNHPLMVSPEAFQKVQRILGGPLRAKPQRFNHPYAGLIRCGDCGCQITAETHVKRYKTTGTTRIYTYYHCTGRKGCRKLSVTEAELEQQILAALDGCGLDPFFADWAIDTLKREAGRQSKLSDVSSETIPEAEQTLKRRLDQLYTMREDGEIGKEHFLERKAKYQADLDAISVERTRQATKAVRDRESLISLLTFGRNGYRTFLAGSQGRKRQVAAAFAEKYVLTLGALHFSLHPGLDLIRTFELPKSRDQQIDSGDPGPLNPIWRANLDALRKIVANADKDFHGIAESNEEHRLAAK